MSNDKKSEKIEDWMKERSKFEAFCLPFSSKFLQGTPRTTKRLCKWFDKKLLGFVRQCTFLFSNNTTDLIWNPILYAWHWEFFFGVFRNVMQIMNIWSRYWMDWNTQTIKNEGNLGRYKKNNFSLTRSLSRKHTLSHSHH